MNSITGPIDTVLSDAIREPDSVPNQTKLLWKSSNTKGGKFITLSLKIKREPCIGRREVVKKDTKISLILILDLGNESQVSISKVSQNHWPIEYTLNVH